MTRCRQGDVVLVPSPFTDLTTVKQRPALVLSADWFNASRSDCVVAALTSQIPSHLQPDEYRLCSGDLLAGGLPKPSLVRLEKLFTISQALLRRRLGTLPRATMEALLRQMKRVFREQ